MYADKCSPLKYISHIYRYQSGVRAFFCPDDPPNPRGLQTGNPTEVKRRTVGAWKELGLKFFGMRPRSIGGFGNDISAFHFECVFGQIMSGLADVITWEEIKPFVERALETFFLHTTKDIFLAEASVYEAAAAAKKGPKRNPRARAPSATLLSQLTALYKGMGSDKGGSRIHRPTAFSLYRSSLGETLEEHVMGSDSFYRFVLEECDAADDPALAALREKAADIKRNGPSGPRIGRPRKETQAPANSRTAPATVSAVSWKEQKNRSGLSRAQSSACCDQSSNSDYNG